jgi:tetratricopeptide (TPR) repeat protein
MALRYADPSRALSLLQEAKNLATDAGNLGAASGFQLFSGSLKNNLGQHRSGISDMKQAVSVLESISNEERARIMSLAGVSDEPVEGTLIMWLASVGWVNEAVDRGEHFVLKTPVSVVHPGLGGSSYADGLAGLATANALLGRPQAARQAYLRAQSVYASIGHHNLVAHKGYDALELIYLRYFPDELASRQDLASIVTLAGRYVSGVAYGAPALFYSVPLSVVEGLWNDARETADQAYRSEGWWVHISGGYWLARLAACQGDSTLSWQIVSSLWPDGPQTKPGDFLIWIGLSLQRLAAELSLDAHDLSAARAWLTAHDRWMEWSGAVLGQADGNLLWSQYHDASGNQERARRHAEQALVQATEPRQPLALIAVHRFLGRIDAEQEQFEASAEHLNRSLALADACAAVFERALTLLEMAKLQASQGNRGQARTLLGEVRAICESLGAKPSLAKLTSLERTFDARGKASNT